MTPGSEFRDGKKSRSGMNIPELILENLVSAFGLKYLNSLMRMRNLFNPRSGIRDGKLGSGINIPDPQYSKAWQLYTCGS
jgi:hypothetical protein